MEENNQHQREENEEQDEERGSGVGGSRWNPTKEQIEILEKMYSDGIRTPSAQQIQQITARLRVYGHIEGKNVFYWFQNHKARQRQKLRQERLAAAVAHHQNYTTCINNIIPPGFVNGSSPHHHHTLISTNNHDISANINLNHRSIFPAPPPSYHHRHYHQVICNPYYQLPQTNPGGFYPPHQPQHHYSAPSGEILGTTKRSKPAAGNHRTPDIMPRGGLPVPLGSTISGYCAAMLTNTTTSSDHHVFGGAGECMGTRTLNLFPVHPTGILEHKLGNSTNNSAENSSATTSCSDDTYTNDNNRIFDFFSCTSVRASSGSD